MWGAVSDERTGLSFTTTAGTRQRSHSPFRHPCDSEPYFTVSDSILPFSLPLSTRWARVEVFDPVSTRDSHYPAWVSSYIASGRTTAQKTDPLPSNGCPLLLRIRLNVCTWQRAV
jgi:hypothetical protein